MQPAPDIETLYNFEGEMEKGFAAQFEVDALPAAGKQQDGEENVTPRYAFKFASGGVFNQHSVICPDGQQRYDMFRGTLSVDVYTHRNENAAEHSKYRSRARNVLHGFRKRFGPEVMPYYEIGDIRESGSLPSFASEKDIDVTTVNFDVVFNVREGAWPTNM